MKCFGLACAALVGIGSPAAAQFPVKVSREEGLRHSLKDDELAGSWIYDDIEAGFAAARKGGKPLLVVFR
ncbi:MAG: hypothetical protein HY721_03370 [Planctomycetes bacterium]|nr:hypothetical protein [Planctomycetota bacterium]